MSLKCQNCGAENVDNAKYCCECGNEIGFYCRKCGSYNPNGKFCISCGTKNGPVNWDEASTDPSDYSRENVYEDGSGTYTADRLVLLSGNYDTKKIEIRQGPRIICNGALGSYLTAEDEYKKAIVEELIIPDSVTQIGRSAFGGCSSLQSVVIPDSVTQIGESLFSGCSSLQSIVIPDSVTRIEGSVFYGCSSLQSIIIPKGSIAKFQELLPQYRDLLIER
ncbi:MAG: leucine-rich repeat protein [Bacteroidales bacterium]|nr:leucine-rich repeat protein [Bacteroidales bacterium]